MPRNFQYKEHLSQERPGGESPNHNIHVSEEPDEIEPTKSQCIEQGLTKELRSSRVIISPVSIEITEHQSSQITTKSLIYLFQNAIRARHEEILSWYYYSDSFENKIIEICRETGVTDKTARTQLYKEMLNHLPGITSGNLRMKTLRAKKIRMLFGKDGVGIEKIKQVSYSIYAISSLTNSQIQNVIKNITSC
ncbi:4590_t:CDS:2 [Ambispora gerdemannii]|uniref:4590_t:CDS:1 n=1 Tax=Ambispora gerdemannii TaxID=144530 RepID=A0A9N9FWW6_9GLOM|nr:4590_t:CDS:2 [Ambispora gerdemannii]